MQTARFVKNIRTIVAILSLGVLSMGGTYWILASAVGRLAERQAENSAITLAPILADRLTARQGLPGLADAAPTGDLAGLALFDRDGTLQAGLGPTSSSHDDAAAAAAAQQGPISMRLSEQGIAQLVTYVPVRGGKSVIKVVSDLDRARSALHREFLTMAIELSFLIGCSFGVPAFAYIWRTRQKQQSEERIDFLAHHDVQTGLINRATFSEALEREIRDLAGTPRSLAVLSINIDRFKTVNDTFGTETGDELIKAVAQRLRHIAGHNHIVARFGGDEFVVAQRHVPAPADAEAMALALAKRLSEPYPITSQPLAITVSIGVSVAPDDGRDAASVLKAADTALDKAKAEGRNTVRLYEPAMDKELQRRRKIEATLHMALEKEAFHLHFQPVIEAQGVRLLGFEVLLRLTDAEGSTIPPAEFIPIAEEMGLISRIGAWVLRRACRVAATWPDELMVAVNLSPRQFEDGNICGIVAAALVGADLPAHRLELEITEGLLLNDSEGVISQLKKLKQLGVSIAMDDFGTGYSSLSYLWRFPFDKLKIDRSFMNVLSTGDSSVMNILKTIVSLGRTLNLQVTAEGIESQSQADILRALECDQLQGYHFGKPMPESDLAAVILRNALNTDSKPPSDRAAEPARSVA